MAAVVISAAPTNVAATGFSNQKHGCALSTGTLVVVEANTTTNGKFWYSTDGGATWTDFGSDIAGWVNGSIAAYVDSGGTERLVAVWKQSGTGGSRTDARVYGMVGTFNAGRTTLTWGTAVDIPASGIYNYPDVVAHAEGGSTGGQLHLVVSSNADTAPYSVGHYTCAITATTIGSATQTSLATNGITAADHFPSIDLDPSTKRLHLAWSWGATGAGKGIRYRTASYSAGAWTWATEVDVDTGYYHNGTYNTLVCRWDAGRSKVVIGGLWFTGAALNWRAAESSSFTSFTNIISTGEIADNGGFAINAANGDIYIVGQNSAYSSVNYWKWTRATTTLGSAVSTDTSGGVAEYTFAWYSGSAIRWVYTKGASSPYSFTYDKLSLNTAPNSATWTTTTGPYDVNATLPLAWAFSDPDAGDTQSAFALKRDIGGATTHWWNGTDWSATVETWVTSTTAALTLASGWGADADADYHFYVNTKDAAGVAAAAYSSVLTVTPSAKVNPTVTAPAAASTIGASSYDAQWTVAQQSAYRVKLYDAAGTTTLWDTGWVTDPTTIQRRLTIGYTLANSTSYKLGVTTKNTEGLASTEAINSFTVSYTPPATPTLTATAGTRSITVVVTNPAPSGSQPAIASNNVWRRHVGKTDSQRIQTGVANNGTFVDLYVGHREALEYQIEAVGTNGVTSLSAWTA